MRCVGEIDITRPRWSERPYREHPKCGMVSRYFLYKRALLAETERLVEAGVLREKEDAFHLTFQELHEAVRARLGP